MDSLFKKEIINLANSYVVANGQLRFGQAIFVAAQTLYPNTVPWIKGTQYDPYYDDSKIDSFLEFLYERVKEKS